MSHFAGVTPAQGAIFKELNPVINLSTYFNIAADYKWFIYVSTSATPDDTNSIWKITSPVYSVPTGSQAYTETFQYPIETELPPGNYKVRAVSARANLIKNPSFETNTTDWALVGPSTGTLARSTAQKSNGTASMSVTMSGTTPPIPVTTVAAEPNRTYTFQFKVRAATTTRSIQAQIRWEGLYGSTITDVTGTAATNTNTGWTTYTVSGAAPASTVQASARILFAASAASEVHYVDDVMFTEGSDTPAYFDNFAANARSIGNSPITTNFVIEGYASATGTFPTDGSKFSWTDDALPYPLATSWNTVAKEGQSAYQVVVEKVSDGSTVADSGKITSSATSATINIPTTAKDIDLRWKVRVYDAYDTASAYSTARTFKILSRPSVTITAPTQGQTISTGNPALTYTVATAGGRLVKTVRAELYSGLTKVWSITKAVSLANGDSDTISDSTFYFTNNTNYQYRVNVIDSDGIDSKLVARDFTVAYTAPAAPGALTVSDSLYDTSGYVSVSWSGASPDADFYAWAIEREDSLVDVSTGSVVSTLPWKEVGVLYSNTAPTNQFYDYSAPSGYQVRYRVRQVAYKFNTVVNGSYTTSGTVSPFTESYWLYAGVNGASTSITALKLHNVTADDFTDEVEEAEFILIGRGRYYERGTELGVNGTLQCKLRNTDGIGARIKRLALMNFKKDNTYATLRNPFGDEYQVSLGAMQVGRIAGTGRDEFVDVSIPYKEVVNR